MTESITIVGRASAPPSKRITPSGRTVADLSVAVTERRREQDGTWVDGTTSWYRVTAWGSLAEHAAVSIEKGDPVIVHGRVRVVDWEAGDRKGRTVEVTAEAMGHSLQFGTSRYARAQRSEPLETQQADPLPIEPADEPTRTAQASQASHAPQVDEAGWALAPVSASGLQDETPF